MKKIIVVLAVSVLAFACKKEAKKTEEVSKKIEVAKEEQTVDKHSSKASLNWSGAYFGNLTTADKEVKTFVILNNDSTYEKITETVGSGKSPVIEEGTFVWSADDCNVIFNNKSKMSFKVIEQGLLLNEETAKSLLTKTDSKTLSENFKGFTMQRFKSGDQNFNILYDTNQSKPTALVKSDFLCEKLVQTNAWAKGAEYESGDYKLVVKGDNLSLFIKGKELKLEAVK